MSSHFRSDPEIDLYSLYLLREVARFRGITAASKSCGLSQSALSRQIQSIEARLGIRVFDRTTRVVTITEAGAVLLRETEAIPNILNGAMRRIREDYLGVNREIKIGIAPDLTLAHISGIFHSQKKHQPDVKLSVSQPEENELFNNVRNASLDLGILTCPNQISSEVVVTHRITDQFVLILPTADSGPGSSKTRGSFAMWTKAQTWLLPTGNSRSRELIDHWAMVQNFDLQPTMELGNFDLMIQFVSMGAGVAFVPRRALSHFSRKRWVKVVPLPSELSRQLIVISPNHTKCPEHVSRFVDGILFS